MLMLCMCILILELYMLFVNLVKLLAWGIMDNWNKSLHVNLMKLSTWENYGCLGKALACLI